MRLAVTYDVSDDTNRRRVYRTLERYGAWRQYSVFELDVSKSERVELEDELEAKRRRQISETNHRTSNRTSSDVGLRRPFSKPCTAGVHESERRYRGWSKVYEPAQANYTPCRRAVETQSGIETRNRPL